MTESEQKQTWRFPTVFWVANAVELLERAAYYGFFIAVTLYLTRVVGFNDIWAAWISGGFSAGLYFLPPFSGALADKMGFRKAVILAFSLLSAGYFVLAIMPYKAMVFPALLLVMLGGSFIKSIITATVAKTTNEKTRARGYSLFYMIVNIGAFSGKTFAYPLRLKLGIEYISYFSALMSIIAVVVVLFFFKNIERTGEGKSLAEVWESLVKVVTNFRLLMLIIIVTGFWIIQHQMYATMPKYVLRTVGESAAPEWIANINPAVVMVFVVMVTHLFSKVKAVTSMTIGMLIMPVSALCMAASPLLESITGQSVSIFGIISLHPVTVAMIVGIMFQGLAECFISPRFLEYFSFQAPKGEEGLYLGFSHLHSFLASLLGFGISGYLLTAYCPDPRTLPATMTEAQKQALYADAPTLWVYFAVIGLVSAIALLIFNWTTKRNDAKKAQLEAETA